MALVKRPARKLITCSEAAPMLGFKSSMSVKRLIQDGKIKGVKRQGSGPTTPWLVYEAEVKSYRDKVLS